LIFFLEASRDRFSVATGRVLADADPEHACGAPRRRRHEGGISFAGQPCGNRFGFAPIVDRRDLDDEPVARRFVCDGC
jgi:hypothetical protein